MTPDAPSPVPEQSKTLFVNLTRFGDLLQSQPVFSAFKRMGRDIGLVCLENFSGSAALLNDVDHVHALPGAKLLSTLDKDWRQSLAGLDAWQHDLRRSFGRACLVNLTSSLCARLLTKLLQEDSGDQARGFGVDEYGFGTVSNPWAAFLLASSRHRGSSPFNLVDLFWNASGLSGQEDVERRYELKAPDPELRARMRGLMDQERPEGLDAGYVALQLGASEDRRRWPVERFAELGAALAKEANCCPVLLGSKGEQELAHRYQEQGAPGVDLSGRTSLEELAAVLAEARLLVTNDTGTMHLAAGLGVPVLAVFLATAQPWDTGPYQENSLCLEPDLECHPCQFGAECANNQACRWAIPARDVLEPALSLLRTGTWLAPNRLDLLGGKARYWLSRRDEFGYMSLESLSGHGDDRRTRWVLLQRHVYRHFLDQRDIPLLEAEQADAMRPDRESATRVKELLRQSEMLLTLLLEQGRVLLAGPREQAKKKFLATWQRVRALWAGSEFFNVLAMLWDDQAQESGRDMAATLAMVVRYKALVGQWQALVD